MKTISLFLALINSIVAGLLLALTLSNSGIRANEIPWLVAKIVAGAGVILIGALTWIACARTVAPGILPIAGLCLVIFGTATLVWTFQRGLFVDHMEYSMAFFGGSLLVQGLASLLGFTSDSRSIAASEPLCTIRG